MPLSDESLRLVREALLNPNSEFAKDNSLPAANFAMGLNYYWADLRQAVQLVAAEFRQPVYFVNSVPRRAGNGGNAVSFKRVTSLGMSTYINPGLSPGQRGGQTTMNTSTMNFNYQHLGLEMPLQFEAELAATKLSPDARAMRMRALSTQYRLVEELQFMYGNNSANGAGYAAGAAPTPTLNLVGSGGSIPTSTAVYVSIVAIGPMAERYQALTIAGGLPTTLTRNNMDGSSTTINCGVGQISASANVTTAAGSSSVQLTWTPVPWAAHYGIFWGASGAAMTLGAIVSINSYLITTAAGAGTQLSTAFAGDLSQNSVEYSGILTQACMSGSGSYLASLPTGTVGVGSKLTKDGKGGINELNTAFETMWNTNFVSPNKLYVNNVELDTLSTLLTTGTETTGRMMFNIMDGGKSFIGGSKPTAIFNRFAQNGQDTVEIIAHWGIPQGTMLLYSDSMPMLPQGVDGVAVYEYQRDYYGIEWALVTRRYDYGVYSDGVLQLQMPVCVGIINNIAAGA